jgi:hypothetical protein
MALRERLAKLHLPADVLWVTSPLSRAIQTLLMACPAVAETQLQHEGEGSPVRPKVIVRKEITERVLTTGDIGHPPSLLCQRFPCLAEQLQQLPDDWWHTHPERPNCAVRRLFESNENKEGLQVSSSGFPMPLGDLGCAGSCLYTYPGRGACDLHAWRRRLAIMHAPPPSTPRCSVALRSSSAGCIAALSRS